MQGRWPDATGATLAAFRGCLLGAVVIVQIMAGGTSGSRAPAPVDTGPAGNPRPGGPNRGGSSLFAGLRKGQREVAGARTGRRSWRSGHPRGAVLHRAAG